MKLLIITSLQEYLPDIRGLLRQIPIEVFSVSKTTGFRHGGQTDLLNDWFGSQPGEYDSIILFSFTEDQKARSAFELVHTFNSHQSTGFPIRAFILPVGEPSDSSYLSSHLEK